jgi:brefeldin A-resistance guanine nucleotide exchange factor 1
MMIALQQSRGFNCLDPKVKDDIIKTSTGLKIAVRCDGHSLGVADSSTKMTAISCASESLTTPQGDHALYTRNDDRAIGNESMVIQSLSGDGLRWVVPRVPVLSSHATSLVLRNELQRLLTAMRSSAGNSQYIPAGRFTEELVDHIHPVAQKMEELQQSLSHDLSESDLSAFVQVVCDAVQCGDVSLAVTGKSLETLQTLLAYGLIQKEDILMQIAMCLVHCKFEVTSDDGPNHLAATPSPSSTSASITRRASSSVAQSAHALQENEEQVAYKLVVLSSLVARLLLSQSDAETGQTNLLVSGLLENCWRVVYKVGTLSSLLHSTAMSALSEVIIHVFASDRPGARSPTRSVATTRLKLLERLSTLLGGTSSVGVSNGPCSRRLTQTCLSLLNLCLELSSGEFSAAEMNVVQDELCKHLLFAANVRDAGILTDTLRVVSNLLPQRENLKVQLEVLLTNVHLRILRERAESPDEDLELVLESLLTCCQESNLVTDLYYNYDCDVVCTDLYESVVAALGRAAMPYEWIPPFNEDSGSAQSKVSPFVAENYPPPKTGTPVTNATINGRIKASGGSRPSLKTHLEASNPKSSGIVPVSGSQYPGNGNAHVKTSTTPLNHLNRLAVESLFAMLDAISKRNGDTNPSSKTESPDISEYDAQQVFLRQCKLTKVALSKVSESFNADHMGSTWMDVAVTEGQLDEEKSAGGVAQLLYTAPGLDKIMVGDYLSKGPSSDYPFHAEVRNQFAALFDFSDLTFAASLRMFLSKFRLPGEAQCIDRLMEAFSGQLYKQQRGKTFFKNADAVYVLSFSTIMLNTDLHNPTIKKDARMTLKQFIRNNRGINGGEDIPEDFLSELYEQIKDKQIQVRREMAEVMMKHENNSDFRTAWEGILAKSHEASTPFFSSCNKSTSETFFHDKQMFSILAKWLVHAIPSAFLRSWDDALVVRALNGMKNMARLAALFEVNWVIDEILDALLPMGRDYISGCVALDYATVNDGGSVVSTVSRANTSTEVGVEDDEATACETELPIPYGLLSSRDERIHRNEIFGSASHRGILALDCSLILLQRYTARVSKAWPSFVECLCGLRDARALPPGLADLDDFADSDGSVLPLSSFAKTSQRRLDEYYRAKSDPDASKEKGWFRSLFKKSSNGKESDSFDEDEYIALDRGELSSYSRALLGIAEACGIESIIQTSSTHEATADLIIRVLLGAVGRYPYDDDPVLEQHAVFALELATRALLSNKQRASDSFALFLNHFENIVSQANETSIPAPFVLERLVVTVLRACIHLYGHHEVRENSDSCGCRGLSLYR